MTFSFHNYNKGFTLIEMLVAVLIFSISLVSLMTIASRSISANRASQNEITAQYLAAEGVEAARHIRDTNYIQQDPWLTGLDICIGEGCYIKLQGVAPHYIFDQCGNNPCIDPLSFDDTNILFGSNVGSVETPFTRTITLEALDTDHVRVSSQVVWEQGKLERFVETHEVLSNWQRSGI